MTLTETFVTYNRRIHRFTEFTWKTTSFIILFCYANTGCVKITHDNINDSILCFTREIVNFDENLNKNNLLSAPRWFSTLEQAYKFEDLPLV